MLLSIIITSYNTQELLLQTLESVFNELDSSALLRHESDVWVVDNHSSDTSVAAIKKLQRERAALGTAAKPIPPLNLIANAKNLGFAIANNQAIRKTQSQFVLLLNSDTIVRKGAIEQLVRTFLAHPIDDSTSGLGSRQGRLDRLGVLAANLFNPDGSFQPQGGSFPTLFSLGTHMLMLDDIPVIGRMMPSTQHTGLRASLSYQEPAAQNHFPVEARDWVGGTAMMIRRQVFEEIGFLDESIFMYGEDVEFCLRARHHHWDIGLSPFALIEHLGSASSSSANAIIGECRGYIYIWSKHKPLWQLPFAKALIWWGAVLRRVIFGTIIKQPARARAYSRVLSEVLR